MERAGPNQTKCNQKERRLVRTTSEIGRKHDLKGAEGHVWEILLKDGTRWQEEGIPVKV